MYQNPSQTPQWSPNGAPPTSQSPSQWSPQPPNGQYTPRQNNNQIPPISQALPQGAAMPTMQPPHPDQYRALPPPQQMYAPPYQQQMPYPPSQPAPRQRTAIACRYCRRRKIRCSGFDQSEDGRCTNCQRFSQECLFTPVSAQTHAFVPAHTVWRGQNPPPNSQLYGAYGQPLPPNGSREQYPAQQQPGQYPPPPQGYQQQPPMYQQPPQAQQPNMQPLQGQQPGTKRPNDEPHTPTMPPPNPAEQGQGQRSVQPFFPDPTGLDPAGASPASSTASFPPAQLQPYYAAPPPAHRASPQSAYSYDPSRASSSPHALGQAGTPAPPTSGSFGPMSPQGTKHQPATQASIKQEERTSTDTTDKVAEGTATTEGADMRQEEMKKRSGEMRDIGVQTEDPPPTVKEQRS